MPKIITLPRRRRRRRPGEPAPAAQPPGVPDTEDTPEGECWILVPARGEPANNNPTRLPIGNARAVAEAERAARAAEAARERNLDDMDRMLAEDQAA